MKNLSLLLIAILSFFAVNSQPGKVKVKRGNGNVILQPNAPIPTNSVTPASTITINASTQSSSSSPQSSPPVVTVPTTVIQNNYSGILNSSITANWIPEDKIIPIPTRIIKYYISNEGIESNSGTDSLHPWPMSKLNAGYTTDGRSIGVRINNDNGGIALLFKRGQTHFGLINVYGNTANIDTIYYDAWGTGTKPVITQMREINELRVSSRWRRLNDTVWVTHLDDPMRNRLPRLILDGFEYNEAQDSTQITSRKRYCWSNTDFENMYLFSPLGNPATAYTSIKSATMGAGQGIKGTTTLMIAGQNNVSIRNLDIRGADGACIDFVTVNGLLVENNVIGLDGTTEGTRASVLSNSKFINNVYDCGRRFIQDFNDGKAGGDGLIVGQGGARNIEGYDNKFYDWRHVGFSVENSTGDSIVNVRFHDNYVDNADIEYGRATAAYYDKGRDVLVDHNTFVDIPIMNQFSADHYQYKYNIHNGMRNNPYYLTGTGIAISIGASSGTPRFMEFSYNTFNDIPQEGIMLNGSLANDGSYQDIQNCIISNNTFNHVGYDVKNAFYDPTFYKNGIDIDIRNNVDVLNNTYTNNIFSRLAADKNIYYRGVLKTTSEFNAAYGSNGDIISGNNVQIP